MPNRFTNPFDIDIHKTERTANQKLVEWMNQIIKEESLAFGFAEQETSGKDQKQPDVVLFKAPRSQEIVLVLELKPPYFNPLDYEQVKEPAWKKANRRRAPYFATSNFKTLFLFNTQKVNEQLPEVKQIVNKYTLSNLDDLNAIDEPIYKNQILKNLTILLRDLSAHIFQGKPEKLLAVDEWLIYLLQEHVNTLSGYYQSIIRDLSLNNLEFRRKLRQWFNNQGWNFVLTEESTYRKAARQTAYWLVNKILFYDVLRSTDPQNYPQIRIPDDFNKGGMVKKLVQSYFDEVLKEDYETIYQTDFIDEVAFPEDKNVVNQIRKLVDELNRFNFGEIEFEVLGRIFEGLIPTEERHLLGQYFTNPDIVDLILQFAIRDEKDTLFDPGCGAGTFLRRAYHLKKLTNPFLSHEKILPTLWGNDIDKFAAGLSTINLAIADLRSKENYPRIIQKDFFEWLPGVVELPELKRKTFVKSLDSGVKEIVVPKYFDAIIGNPPYTRQEEMDGSGGEKGQEYKEKLIERAVLNEAGKPYANLTKRAGLYAYFFVHGTKFLKQTGRFGFVVSNSWLDVDYGKGLQEHFLKHYQIKAIIESKVERWFPEADINTCIVLLEKCAGGNSEEKKAREENLVRFVCLKKPLSAFIPKASRIFEETVERKSAVEKFLENIFSKTSFFENDDLRVFVKSQKELWEEGFDKELNEYHWYKWSRYFSSTIYFKIASNPVMTTIKDNQEIKIKRGLRTGDNRFFYPDARTIERFKIEKEYLTPLFRSPSKYNRIWIDEVDDFVLSLRAPIADKRSGVYDYLKYGEQEKVPSRSMSPPESWHSLPLYEYTGGIAVPQAFNKSYVFHQIPDNYVVDQRFLLFFYSMVSQDLVAAVFNSTIFHLLTEIFGRKTLGLGALDITSDDVSQMPFIKLENIKDSNVKAILRIFENLKARRIGSVFEEIGAERSEEVSLKKVKTDRRELDRIIMGEILGLTEEEQLEVYRAVVDLVKSRLDRAKSVTRTNKTKEGIDLSLLVKTVMDKIGGNKLGVFYQRRILSQKNLTEIKLPELSEPPKINPTLMGFQLVSGRELLDFGTEEEARFALVFLEAGWSEVQIPKDKEVLKKLLPQLEKIATEVKEAIGYYTEGVLDPKIKSQVEHLVWSEVSKTSSPLLTK